MAEGDVFGDGVNIAARIEALGIPGSVLLSHRVYQEIRNKPHLECQSLGCFQLKNVEEPVEVYALAGDWLNIPEKKNPTVERTPFLDSNQRKSILVLPFENRSQDPEQEYFSDGLTDELITDLSGLKALRVIARNASMKLKGTQKELHTLGEELQAEYALEGSVRQAGNTLRINAQLVDIATGSTLWASRYTGHLKKVFDFQEEVSRSIVDALHLQLNQEEDQALAKHPIPNLMAYDSYLKARKETITFSETGIQRALDFLKKGKEIVGENPILLYGQGAVYFQMLNSGISTDENPIALFCAVRLFLAIGLKEEAYQQLDVLLEKHPDTPFTKGSKWLIEALNGPLTSEFFDREKAFLDWTASGAWACGCVSDNRPG